MGGEERRFFPGGNTPSGFTSFYDYIYGENEKNVFILKGGPGTGKSGLIRKIAKIAKDEKYDIEILRCSGDPESLDGVRIPELMTTILDGTSPHTVDASMPGVRDNIVNLGDFWDTEGIRRHACELKWLNTNKKEHYNRAYTYLKAASVIKNNIDRIADRNLNIGKTNILADNICKELFNDIDISMKQGVERKLFASAITGKGIISELDSMFQGMNVYAFKCDFGSASKIILEKLKYEYIIRGFAVEAAYCPLNPDKLEHLIIPQIKTAFTTFNEYHRSFGSNVIYEYPLTDFYNEVEFEKNENEYDIYRIGELLDRASRSLAKASKSHMALEDCYTPYMDFDAVNLCTEIIVGQVFGESFIT